MKDLPKFVHPGTFRIGFDLGDGERLFRGTHGIVHPLDGAGFRLSRNHKWGANPDALRIIAIGCSYVFGYGIETHDTWPEQFARLVQQGLRLQCEVKNLGVPGASSDYVVRQVIEGIEGAMPHVLLVAFPQKERREYWDNQNKSYFVRPGAPHNADWSARRAQIQSASEVLSSRANDLQRLYQARSVVSGFCRLTDTMLIYTFASVNTSPPVTEWRVGDSMEYVGMPFPVIDYAADGRHPGPRSNRLLALKTLTTLCRRFEEGSAASRRISSLLPAPRSGSALGSVVPDPVDGYASPY